MITKKVFIIVFLGILAFGSQTLACNPDEMPAIEFNVANLSTTTFCNLINAQTKMTIIDARTDKCIDGERIPGAKYLNASSTIEEISKILPNKDQLVVIYSTDETCTKNNQHCAKRLFDLGFWNLALYNEGIKAWKKHNLPIEYDK